MQGKARGAAGWRGLVEPDGSTLGCNTDAMAETAPGLANAGKSLLWAINTGDTAAAARLLEEGAPVDWQDSECVSDGFAGTLRACDGAGGVAQRPGAH